MFYNQFISFFVTNLLTQCPVPVVVFYIAGNQYQTETKHCETFCGFFMDQKTTSGPKKHLRGWVVPTSVASRTPSLPYKFQKFQKPSGVTLDHKFHRRRPL